MSKSLAYQHAGYRVWMQGRKVWVEYPDGQVAHLPVHQPSWPKKLRRCMGAVLLKAFSDGHGIGLAIPAEDLKGPNGSFVQAHYVSTEEHNRALAGEPFERIVPAYQFSHISVFIEGGRAWITNGSGERIDVPLEGTDEVPPTSAAVSLLRYFKWWGTATASLGHSQARLLRAQRWPGHVHEDARWPNVSDFGTSSRFFIRQGCVFRRKRPGVSGSSTFPMHTDDGRNFDDHIQVTPQSVT